MLPNMNTLDRRDNKERTRVDRLVDCAMTETVSLDASASPHVSCVVSFFERNWSYLFVMFYVFRACTTGSTASPFWHKQQNANLLRGARSPVLLLGIGFKFSVHRLLFSPRHTSDPGDLLYSSQSIVCHLLLALLLLALQSRAGLQQLAHQLSHERSHFPYRVSNDAQSLDFRIVPAGCCRVTVEDFLDSRLLSSYVLVPRIAIISELLLIWSQSSTEVQLYFIPQS